MVFKLLFVKLLINIRIFVITVVKFTTSRSFHITKIKINSVKKEKNNNAIMNTTSREKEVEEENFKKLKVLIEALTHSGANTLDEDIFKQVKKICKSSQDYILKAYNLLLKQLKKNHSQIRFLAFQICKELFTRSSVFRECLLKDLQLVFELTSEINSGKKLPPPKSAAQNLKSLALSTIKNWVEEYGETYKKLKVAYNYLIQCKRVNFETLQVRNSVEGARENEQARLQRIMSNERLKKLLDELNSNAPEIEMTITSLSNCLSLLLPPLEEFFISDVNLPGTSTDHKEGSSSEVVESDVSADKNDLRHFGLTATYSLSLELKPSEKIKITRTDENASIIENANDCVRLLQNRYLPMVKKWSHICCKYSDRPENELKRILDLKEKLEKVLKKYNELVIDGVTENVADGSSSDDDFEEVKKEGYEETVDLSEDELVGKLLMKNEENICLKPPSKDLATASSSSASSSIDSNITSRSESQELDRKSKLLSIAPKLPFDIDLYHWEDENLTTPTLISTKIDVDKFWGSCASDDIHEIPNPEGVAALRTRVIEFTGTFEPVKWECRAPLPSGKLCPRRDRFKCPFHGKIVARDETGKCKNEEDERKTKETLGECSSSSWQDPELLEDLRIATGVDLKVPDKKNKRKKSEVKNLTHKKMKTSKAALRIVEAKKLPGLVDVVKRQNNSYTRLAKKIFNRSAVKRVSAVLNKLDKNKYNDKFGDQFNYT